jgi:hypothetical protein
MRVKKGFFTNGCKKATKHVQIVHKIIHKKEALEEGLLDIFVKSAPATPFGQLVGNPSNRYK